MRADLSTQHLLNTLVIARKLVDVGNEQNDKEAICAGSLIMARLISELAKEFEAEIIARHAIAKVKR